MSVVGASPHARETPFVALSPPRRSTLFCLFLPCSRGVSVPAPLVAVYPVRGLVRCALRALSDPRLDLVLFPLSVLSELSPESDFERDDRLSDLPHQVWCGGGAPAVDGLRDVLRALPLLSLGAQGEEISGARRAVWCAVFILSVLLPLVPVEGLRHASRRDLRCSVGSHGAAILPVELPLVFLLWVLAGVGLQPQVDVDFPLGGAWRGGP